MTIRDLYDQFELQGHIVIKSFDDSGENETEHYSDSADRLYTLSDTDDEWILDAEIKYMYPQYEYVQYEFSNYGKTIYAMIVIEIERD